MTTGSKKQWQRMAAVGLAGFLWAALPEQSVSPSNPSPLHQRVLVQGATLMSVETAVRAVGGEVTHELGIINAVGARLTQAQIRQLEARDKTLRVQADRSTNVSGARPPKRSGGKAKRSGGKAKRSGGKAKRSGGKHNGWDEEAKRAKKISREWEKAAEKAAREAAQAVKAAEELADVATLEQALEVKQDAQRWETTVKQWNKEWAKDAFCLSACFRVTPYVVVRS